MFRKKRTYQPINTRKRANTMNENYNSNNYEPNPQYPYPAYQPKKNHTVPILIVIACIAVAVIFLIMSLSGGKSIDMKDYVTVSYSGTEGNGTAVVDVDYDGMCEQLLTKERRQQMEYISGSQEVIKSAAKYMDGNWELIQAMKYTVEPDSGLSNGDTVTVTFAADKETLRDLGVSVKHPTLTFTVSGLY